MLNEPADMSLAGGSAAGSVTRRDLGDDATTGRNKTCSSLGGAPASRPVEVGALFKMRHGRYSREVARGGQPNGFVVPLNELRIVALACRLQLR